MMDQVGDPITNEEADLGMVEPAEFAEEPITGTMEQTVEMVENNTGWSIKNLVSLTTIKDLIANPSASFFSSLKPISEFIGPSQFAKPASKGQVVSRLHKNLPYFFSNYLVLFGVFLVFTIITQPLLFFSVCLISYGWVWATKQETLALGPVKLEGKTKFASLSALTLVAVFLVAGSSILWVMVLTMGASSAHAVCHTRLDALENEEDDDIEIAPLV